MKNLKLHQVQLLELVSFSLFGGEEKDIAMTREILKEAKQQEVLTLVNVDAEVYPNVATLYEEILVNNIRVDHEHAEIHELLEKAGIPYVGMKGCASASYYPEPIFRTMGDVDVLVSSADIPKVSAILQENEFCLTEESDSDCHLAFERDQYDVFSTWEVHWKPNGIPKGEIGERIEEYLSDIILNAQEQRIDGGTYMVPTAFHHGLIMLLHVAEHLINTGVGLRHLCDWAVFVEKFSDDEFCSMFEDKLKAVGLWRFAQLLTQLSIKYLRCPAKNWCGVGDDAYLESMMVDIFDGGNFGIKDDNRINQAKLMTNAGKGKVDDTSLLKQLFLTMNEKARRGMPVTAKMPILLPVGWIYVGGRHLVRIARGKRPSIQVKDMIAGATERKEIYKEFRLFEID